MKLSCLHTHSTFCDGTGDIETMCETAYAKGFSSIGFSSHAPITKKTGIKTDWIMQDENLEEYIDTVLQARRRWKGKLAVYLGLETDYIHGYSSPADPDIQALPLDYIIGTVHYCVSPKNGRPINVDEYTEGLARVLKEYDNDGRALCESYFDSYGMMIAAGGYDILAHLDLIKKNNDRFCFFSPDDSWYTDRLVKTADLIAGKAGKANIGCKTGGKIPVVEVNNGGMNRGYCTEPYPSLYILKLLKERNIPLTISADAHAPDHLGKFYDTAAGKIRQAGYNSLVFLEEQGWREEPL